MLFESVFVAVLVFSTSSLAGCVHVQWREIITPHHTVRNVSTNVTCPSWTNKDKISCVCKDKYFDGKLKCDRHTNGLSVLDCYCLTYVDSFLEVGACVENCINVDHKLHDTLYHLELSPNQTLSSVNKEMCQKHFNRAGRLCGKCLPDYSPQAYSYNMTCVPNCTEGNQNLWKYFVYSLAPLTIFYFFVLFFKLNTTSSHLHGFVLFAQAITIPQFSRIMISSLQSFRQTSDFIIYSRVLKFLVSLYGFWSLDFFRMFNLGVCLNMAPLTVVALDYIIAVYPFFLTVISYILIELHARNYRLLVWIWKPFRCVFTLFRRNWDIRTSIIDAYATFFFLSCYKIICISYDLLAPTFVYKVGQPKENATLVVFYDGTIDFFGDEHLPYALVAIIFSLLFVVFPTLLLLVYPCRCFQYLLNHCHFHSHILQTFMDSLNGCYKDGTDPGTSDCRWFSLCDLSSKCVLFVVYMLTRGALFFPFAILVLLVLVILLSQLQPHKANVAHYTKIDVTFYSLLLLFYTSLCAIELASTKSWYFTKSCYVVALIISFVPLVYMGCLSIHWLFSRRRCGRTLLSRLRAWRRGYDLLDESLPDRLRNPGQYSEQGLEEAASAENSYGNSTITQDTY